MAGSCWDGLRPSFGYLGLGRAADFLGLGGERIELLPPIDCVKLHDLREAASARQALG